MSDSPFLNPSILIWFIAGFILFFSYSAFRYIRKVFHKRDAFRFQAHQMGFGYFLFSSDLAHAGYDLPYPLRPRQAGLSRGRLGLEPATQNILRGEKNGWTIFYLETPSQERDGSMETLALFQKPGSGLPYFEIVPLRLFDKFHRLLELDIRDIVAGPEMGRMEIKGLGDFKRPRHHLWGETHNARKYENLFSKEFLEYLVEHPNWRLQGRGDWVMIYEENIAVPPEALRVFADETLKAMDLFFSGWETLRTRVPVEAVQGRASGPQDGGGNPADQLVSGHRTAGNAVREGSGSGEIPPSGSAHLSISVSRRVEGNKTGRLYGDGRIFLPAFAERT
jgi:hypothetical protein